MALAIPQQSRIDFRIYRSDNVFVARATETISFGNLLRHVIEIMTDGDYKAGIHGLYDFSSVDGIVGNIEDWESVASGMSDHEIIPQPACTAIVISSGNTTMRDIMEDYLKKTEGSLIDYQLFTEQQWSDAFKHVGLEACSQLDEDLTFS